jgi:PiT family inorganic phosphate transporter
MLTAIGLATLLLHISKKHHPTKLKAVFGKLQLLSAALFSIGHGMNDSQKVMGIIGAALMASQTMGLGYGINSIDELPN